MEPNREAAADDAKSPVAGLNRLHDGEHRGEQEDRADDAKEDEGVVVAVMHAYDVNLGAGFARQRWKGDRR